MLATDDEIRSTMNKAWCPEGIVEENPVLLLNKYVIMPISGKLKVERKMEHGGDVEYMGYGQLVSDYQAKKLHPMDLKSSTASALIDIMKPIQNAFEKDRSEILEMLAVK